MGEPAYELESEEALQAEDALHGVVNQLIVNGRRMPVIIPGSVIEIMPVLAGLLKRAQSAQYLSSLLRVAMPWVSALPEGDFALFASDLAQAADGGAHAPERVAACLREWQATAEAYADPTESARLRQAIREADEGEVTPWEYDDTSA